MSGDGVAIAPYAGQSSPAPPPADRSVPRIIAGPPGWPFHLIAAVASIALLWAGTAPYGNFAIGAPAALVLLALAALWGLRAVAHLIARLTGWRTTGRARWWLVAPLGGVLVVALSVADVPLQARWSASRSEFEQVVANSEGTEGNVPIDGRLGLYDISSVSRTGDSVVFYEETGGFIDMVGFAYLPDGTQPLRDHFPGESVDVDHLEGDWYTFSASW